MICFFKNARNMHEKLKFGTQVLKIWYSEDYTVIRGRPCEICQ